MATNNTQPQNEKDKKPLGTDIPVEENSRPSVSSDAPHAEFEGRETVSETAPPSENTASVDNKKVDVPTAGGMKTISDRQAFLAHKMANTVAKYKGADLKDLYDYARSSVYSDSQTKTGNSELNSLKLDQSKALLFACHQAMVNSSDNNLKQYATSFEEQNEKNFQISPADCNKLTSDLSNPNTDWSTLEAKNKETQKGAPLTDRQKEMAKAEIAGLQKQGLLDLAHAYSDATKETLKNASLRDSKNVKDAEQFDKSFAKMLAGEYVLRQQNKVFAERTLHVNRGVFEQNLNVSADEIDTLMNELGDFDKKQQELAQENKKAKKQTEQENLDSSEAEIDKESPLTTNDGAPIANEPGRETVSDLSGTKVTVEPTNDATSKEEPKQEEAKLEEANKEEVSKGEPLEEKPKEETPAEQTPKTDEKRIAGGMKTISDRQALMAREMSKNIGKHDIDEMVDLYSQARDRLNEANKNLNDTPESIQKRDESVANLLAIHQSMANSTDKAMNRFAESCVEANRMSFGISKEDTDQFSKDVASPNTDWSSAEKNVSKEDQPQRLAGYAKAELEGLKGKNPQELFDYFAKARRDAKNALDANEKNGTKETEEAYERSFGKLLAGEHALRGTPGLQSKAALNSADKLYENSFHMTKADRDAMMERIDSTPVPQPEKTPVHTPTVEGVVHPVNNENEYPEAPKEKEVNGKEKSKKEEKLSPEQLKGRMEHAGKLLETTIGKPLNQEDLAKFEKNVSDLQNISPELRGPMFAEMFRDHAKSQMQSSISATLGERKSGKTGATFSESSAAAQTFLKAQFDYYTATNPDLNGMKYPTLGGLQPSEVRDMQNTALLSLPVQSQQPNEKKAIGDEYIANKAAQKQEITTGFRSEVAKVNGEMGVKFSSEGIEKYLAARWKEGAGKDLDTQRDHFQKEYREFKEKAYEQMLSKIDGKTDLKKQLGSFDRFCSSLDTLCKSKGWVDKNAPYSFAGDLSAETLKNMQTKAVANLPKNTAEKAAERVDDLTGDKERRQQAEHEKKQKEELKNIKGSTKKDKEKRKNLQEKAALDKKNSQKKLQQKEKNFQNEIQKCLDNVPANPKSFDNPAVRNALGMARALENKLGEHGKAWRFFHPFKTRNINKAINGIMDGLEKKGYKKEAIDHLLHNPQKPETDPVSQDINKQKNDIKEIQNNRDKLDQEQREFQQNKDKLDKGERITVPEADNVKDIVKPKERSKFIVPQKTNELTIGGPTQTSKEPVQQQQPQGPTTGK